MRFAFKSTRFFTLFNFHDEQAKGRSCMLLSSVIASVISWLTTGLFYTSFLMANGIDIVKIGIITFVPFIANCFSIFSPSILERFKKRKAVLAASRTAFYTLNILGITVMPYFVQDPALKMTLFVGIVFAANIINALFTSGYQVWQVNFIPNQVRAEYFSTNTLITAFIGCGAALVSSVVADALAGSPYQDTIIVIFRYTAYALALLDVLILSLPKEYPYSQTQAKPRFRDIFIKPFQHKKFVMTMGIVFAWTFCINVPLSSVNYYLINNVGVDYTFIYTINMFYPIFLLIFLPPWKKILAKLGWFKTFAYAALLHIPTNLVFLRHQPNLPVGAADAAAGAAPFRRGNECSLCQYGLYQPAGERPDKLYFLSHPGGQYRKFPGHDDGYQLCRRFPGSCIKPFRAGIHQRADSHVGGGPGRSAGAAGGAAAAAQNQPRYAVAGLS